MKKWMWMMAVMLAGSLALTGCGSDSDDDDDAAGRLFGRPDRRVLGAALTDDRELLLFFGFDIGLVGAGRRRMLGDISPAAFVDRADC